MPRSTHLGDLLPLAQADPVGRQQYRFRGIGAVGRAFCGNHRAWAIGNHCAFCHKQIAASGRHTTKSRPLHRMSDLGIYHASRTFSLMPVTAGLGAVALLIEQSWDSAFITLIFFAIAALWYPVSSLIVSGIKSYWMRFWLFSLMFWSVYSSHILWSGLYLKM